MNTIFYLSQYARQALKDTYPEHEIQSICRIIYMDVLHFTNIDIHLRKNECLSESFVNIFYDIVGKAQKGEPIQYILGETTFAGRRFRVNRSTLIPRPETEELVRWAGEYVRGGMRVLDIGTGSGCIAISLASHCPQAKVYGIDIARNAVQTARENAREHGAEVHFTVRDILHFEQYRWETYNVIASNPPYVRESEKEGMERNVLAYEPASALFVPDEDPLVFYHRIAEFCLRYLRPGGNLFFEINEALGAETAALLRETGFEEVEVRKDFYGKERMVRASQLKRECYPRK